VYRSKEVSPGLEFKRTSTNLTQIATLTVVKPHENLCVKILISELERVINRTCRPIFAPSFSMHWGKRGALNNSQTGSDVTEEFNTGLAIRNKHRSTTSITWMFCHYVANEIPITVL